MSALHNTAYCAILTLCHLAAPMPNAMRDLLITRATVLLPNEVAENHAVAIQGGRIIALSQAAESFDQLPTLDLQGDWLVPGFIDLQVNGGGGVLFNDAPNLETLRCMLDAQRRFGTTRLLPTLISSEPARMQAAIDAVREAQSAGLQGVLGLHLEGPFLNPLRRGVHDAAQFRSLTQDDVDWLCAANCGHLMLTLAPELQAPELIARLAAAQVRVMIGHSAADTETTRAALRAGARGFTHLFNAMPPWQGRAPGVLGAALLDDDSYVGLIVDGHHLHPASIDLALRCKPRGRCVLVTDAMSTVGSTLQQFQFGSQTVTLRNGCLQTDDGTLAGSALDMISAVKRCIQQHGLAPEEAFRMASTWPADLLGRADLGRIAPGASADLLRLSPDLQVKASWLSGAMQTHV